ncbi:MAG: hypothetical protein SFU53_06540 [Terrimicrobiaceae bacterium]|nr:hypothetical protein [Terrimicrobiaceae bacterium]
MAAGLQDPDDVFASSGGGSSFDVVSYLLAARKYWWLIVLCLGGGLAAGLVAIQMTPPEYVSSAEIRVERRAASSAISLSGGPMTFEGATSTEDLKTIEKSFASPMLMKRVADQIRREDLKDLELGGKPALSLDDAGIAGWLLAGCTVSLIPDTRLIRISFRNSDPAMAQKITGLIVSEGIQNDLDQRIAASSTNIRYLRDEVKKFEESLRSSEEKLNAYTRTLGNVSIDGDINIVANQLKELNSRLTSAKAERLRIETDYAQAQAAAGDAARLMKIESIQKLPSIVALSNQIGEVRSRIAKLSLRYRESNPFMRQAASELAELEQALQNEILLAPKSIEAALAAARRNEESILREQEKQEEKVIQVRDLAVPSRVLQRQIDADRMAYEAALRRLSEELSQARNQPVLLQVVNPASYGFPSGSRGIKLLGIALFLGAAAGFGGIFLITQLDTSMKSPEEVERLLGVSVLSAVPEFQTPKDDAAQRTANTACPVVTAPFSPTAEAVRSLRAALRALEDEEPGNGILVVAPGNGDGATFSALNLATVLAQAGQRTVLVDSNLREPALEKLTFDTVGRAGLADYLHREAGLAEVLHPSSIPQLDIVPAGRPCPFPAESLSRERVAALLEELRPLYDKIVFDAAPAGAFSDVLGYARLFPFLCLVVRASRTPKAAARRSVEILRRAGARISGIVLNGTPAPFHNRFLETVAQARGAEIEEVDSQAIRCPSCGTLYRSLSDFVARTTAPTNHAPHSTSNGTVSVFRKCSCGHEFGPSAVDLRDRSPAGLRRRQRFGELLLSLESAGLTRDEARRHLLLTLKLWRNERFETSKLDGTRSGGERSRLAEEVVDRLVQAGETPEGARRKLADAIESWSNGA